MTVIGMTSSGRNLVLDRAGVDPWRVLGLFLTVQAAAWIVAPAVVFSAPQSNTIELALWVRDWFVVNYKHPALPAWLLGFGYALFGIHLWVSLLLAQLCIGAAYVFVFLLGRDLMGGRAALFGTLLLPVVSHFTIDALRYNHNVVQLPLWIAFCFGLWRAARSERLPWWIFTAAIAALGLYAKFTMALVIAFGALWILLDAEARQRLRGRALFIGLLVCLALLLPLAIALGQTEFNSLTWVSQESAKRGISGASFIGDIGRTVLVMAAALLAGALANRLPPAAAVAPSAAIEARAFRFLLVMGAGPLLLTLAVALAKPSRLEWAAPMFSLIGLLLVAAVIRLRPSAARWTEAHLRHGVLALVASLTVLGGQAARGVEDRASSHAHKQNWPLAEMSARFDQVWQQATGRPLRIVAGDSWTAGAVGLMSAGHPSLFTDLDPARAPAITPARLAGDGLLLLWTAHSSWTPDPALVAEFPHGSQDFALGTAGAPLTVDYMIVAPGRWTDADWDRWLERDQEP